MNKFLEKNRESVLRLISPGDRVLAAVSGGPDSVALLSILDDMRSAIGFELSIAHLDHMARGKESRDDALFVKRLGEKFGLETHMEVADVFRETKTLKTSFQEAARIVRYRFLRKTLTRIGGTKLALGHNADDQVETILIHLIRGSGLKGLAGMPESRGEIIRPLIECTRTEIEDYLAFKGLESRTDSSNASNKYIRNRIRHELIPVLNKFNANMAGNLREMAKIIRDDDDCLAEHTGRLFSKISIPPMDGHGVLLDREQFIQQSPAYQKRLVRQAVFRVQGSLRRISTRHIHQIIELFKHREFDKSIHLPAGLTTVSGPRGIHFTVKGKAAPKDGNISSVKPLAVPGATRIEKAGICLRTQFVSPKGWVDREKIPGEAFIDFDRAGPGIQARFFRPGDRFIPLGMKGRKKLKDFFIDEKIPRESRRSLPVLTTRADDIIWVYGKRISENFRVTEKTRKILHIVGSKVSQSFSGE